MKELGVTGNPWSSYDRIWFSGPDKQEILILIFTGNPTIIGFASISCVQVLGL
jgi:hypothetical protein